MTSSAGYLTLVPNGSLPVTKSDAHEFKPQIELAISKIYPAGFRPEARCHFLKGRLRRESAYSPDGCEILPVTARHPCWSGLSGGAFARAGKSGDRVGTPVWGLKNKIDPPAS